MSYSVLEKKLKSLPEQSLEEVDDFFDYILYKFNTKKSDQPSKNSLSGMELLNSIVGIVPQNISIEQAKDDYFGEKYGTSNWY